MDFKYLRFRAFERFLAPFQQRMRVRRMKAFSELMGLDQRMRILDVGGLPGIWDSIETVQDITFLNLPGVKGIRARTQHDAHLVEGDACHVDQYGDNEFDLIFSNSVIEHVGSDDRIRDFAREVQRLARSYWVQTPARWFPIEAHCGMPFWWFYPRWLRDSCISRWKKKLPEWTKMVEGTRVLTRRQLEDLFPDAEIYVERFLGIPKSYAAYVAKRSLRNERCPLPDSSVSGGA